MAGNHKKKQSSRTSLKEFVTVAFAEDVELAKDYKKLLSDENIPVAIKEQPDSSSTFHGIAVMVPEEYLDEAHVLIESQGVYSDFYDMVFGDSDFDDEDMDEDIFDADA